jgi:hypothetical protein
MCDYRRGMDWILELLTILYTTRNYTLQFTDTHRLVYSVYYSLHKPFSGNGFYRGRFFNFPHSGPLVTAASAELVSTANSQLTGPQAGGHYTSLLVFSSQADFQLGMDNWTLSLTNQQLHSAELPTTDYSGIRLTLLKIFRHEIHRKRRYYEYYYSPTVSRPLFRNGCLLSAYCISKAVLVRFDISAQQRIYIPQYNRSMKIYYYKM